MKKAVIVIVVILFLAMAFGVVHAEHALKDFAFRTIDGNTLAFKELKGKPLVINIGAHWWNKCKREAPALQKAYDAFRDKGVLFVGVFVMSKDHEIGKFVETYGITFPVGKENGIAKVLGAPAIPTTVFIDKDGKVAERHIGEINYGEIVSGIDAIMQ